MENAPQTAHLAGSIRKFLQEMIHKQLVFYDTIVVRITFLTFCYGKLCDVIVVITNLFIATFC